jgi:hypothetical protein
LDRKKDSGERSKIFTISRSDVIIFLHRSHRFERLSEVRVMARGYLDMMLAITSLLAPFDRRNTCSSCSLVTILLKTPGCRFFALSISTPIVSKLFSRSSFSKALLSALIHFAPKGLNETNLRRISAECWIIQHLEPKRKLLLIFQRFLDAIMVL